jgi:hypothetical protein
VLSSPGGRPVPVVFASFWRVTAAVRVTGNVRVTGAVRMIGAVRVSGAVRMTGAMRVSGAVRVTGVVRGPPCVPPPGMVSSLPGGPASAAVHAHEDQQDGRKEDNQKYPCVGNGTGDPQATADGDAGQHCLALSEKLSVA